MASYLLLSHPLLLSGHELLLALLLLRHAHRHRSHRHELQRL
jgi:hypothetical protein